MITLRRLLFVLAPPVLVASCAEMYTRQPVGASIDLADTCGVGPYCVSGAVTGQDGAPLAGVRCVAEWSEDEPTVVVSDRRGLFAMLGLPALPRKLRFEKDGFEAQPVSVVAELRRRSGGADATAAPAPVATGAGASPTQPGQSVGAAAAVGSGGTENTSESSAPSSSDAGATNRALIGDDLRANELSPEEQFDFGDGRTIRVFVTMRRR
jgi:hypothetical protein